MIVRTAGRSPRPLDVATRPRRAGPSAPRLKRDFAMIQDLQVRHNEYGTIRSFEEVTAAFEAVVGTLEEVGWASIPAAAAKDLADFDARVKETIGPRGFTRV
jgi:hypothetical protein